ncbi:MAG: HAMP domain-containing protein [Anaerolineae bacterium]|nr:HAMP domain-containing protein [Anaerolineae bacterium]
MWRVVGGVSVRTKILGIVLGLVALLGLVVTFQVRAMLIHVLRDQLQQASLSVSHDVAARSTDLVLINDLYALNRLLQDTQQHNLDIRYLFVLDREGQVLAHTFGTGFPLTLLDANYVADGNSSNLRPLQTEEGLIWDSAVPIFGGRAGIARVGLHEEGLWRTVNTITAQIILSILLLSVGGVAAAYGLMWLLTRPILDLAAATARVGAGDYSPQVGRWANDEVGDLTEAFNAMVARLAQAEEERSERERIRQFYLARIIHAQEEERQRIAREMHEETGQALASMMVGLRNVDEAPSADETRERLQLLRQVLATTLERVRRLAFELRPSVLDDLGLVPALRRYGQEYEARFGIQTEVQAVGWDGHRLGPAMETAIYRIVQEAMTNAAKYARCHHVSVLLQVRDEQLSVIVEDDGIGFDVHRVLSAEARQTKLGLYGMQERAELVGGRLDIESQPGMGTTIYLRTPMLGDLLAQPALGA